MSVLTKFADDIKLRPSVTKEKDWNTSWKELYKSVDWRKK